ncbi:hypothetical protein HYC85_018216, partial [Camellia sinensis]
DHSTTRHESDTENCPYYISILIAGRGGVRLEVSNIIYLDSPAGVGFSYSENMTFYSTGDLQTASETNIFLLKWFNLFPEFLSNPFYIAGESYGGIYVPTLASEIVKGILGAFP